MDGSFVERLSLSDALAGAGDDRRGALLDALERLGVVTAPDARHVRSILEDSRDPLDQIICKLGLAAEDRLADAYAEIFSLRRFSPHAHSAAHSETPAEVRTAFNPAFLFAKRIMPLAVDETQAAFALVDPSDREAVEGAAFALERSADLTVVTASQFDRLFAVAFPETGAGVADIGSVDASADVSHLKDMASAEPVVRYVNRMIAEAARRRASDIHVEPMARQTLIRLRIDGALVDFDSLAGGQALSVVSRLKILADLDIAEQRRPQDGRTSFPVGGRAIDLRLSTTPTVNGESLVVRLLDQSRAPLDLEGLGFDAQTRRQLTEWIAAPNGIILLTGPTGSGKTTTLYALLRLLATGERKILTIEDPVEYKLAGVHQSQVNSAIDVTFANALRSFLRHDPDVIMVGEMRDAETARIAMRAAMTGHLVLSTLHTNDAASAVTRLLDMGVEDYLVASTLLGVVGQRLVRRICNQCANGAGPAAGTTEENGSVCPQCDGSGYYGRIVVAEALTVDSTVRNAIKTGARAGDIRAAAKDMIAMPDDGRRKAEQGLVALKDVNRATL